MHNEFLRIKRNNVNGREKKKRVYWLQQTLYEPSDTFEIGQSKKEILWVPNNNLFTLDHIAKRRKKITMKMYIQL